VNVEKSAWLLSVTLGLNQTIALYSVDRAMRGFRTEHLQTVTPALQPPHSNPRTPTIVTLFVCEDDIGVWVYDAEPEAGADGVNAEGAIKARPIKTSSSCPGRPSEAMKLSVPTTP